MMAKWKELTTDPEILAKLLVTLKDKEAKLEADLAIKECPELEAGITQVVLVMNEVRRLDASIMKNPKPETEEDQRAVEVLCNQLEFYRHKLAAVESSLQEKGGKAAKKYAELRRNRREALKQLSTIFSGVGEVFASKGIDLKQLLPSIADFTENLP